MTLRGLAFGLVGVELVAMEARALVVVSEEEESSVLRVSPWIVQPVMPSPVSELALIVKCVSNDTTEVLLDVLGSMEKYGSERVEFRFQGWTNGSWSSLWVDVLVQGIADGDNSDGPQAVRVSCATSADPAVGAGSLFRGVGSDVTVWNRWVSLC
jgi:hypothetical protein